MIEPFNDHDLTHYNCSSNAPNLQENLIDLAPSKEIGKKHLIYKMFSWFSNQFFVFLVLTK